ncbi:MAG: hypothetical protein ACRCXZ_07085 [Patescibacteria group bacterium]
MKIKLVTLLLVLTLLFGNFGYVAPAFAGTHLGTIVNNTQDQQLIDAKSTEAIQNLNQKLAAMSIHFQVYLIDDAQENMEKDSLVLLGNAESNSAQKSIVLLIAKNRLNRLGSRPALRLTTSSSLMSTEEINSALDGAYYPGLQNSGFNTGLQSLVANLDQKFTTTPASSLVSTQKSEEGVDPLVVLGLIALGGGGLLTLMLMVGSSSDRKDRYSSSKNSNRSTSSGYSSSRSSSTSSYDYGSYDSGSSYSDSGSSSCDSGSSGGDF